MTTAVLFIIFNRPGTTRQVFDAIRKARPARLYVAADGPRDAEFGEPEKCEQARRIATHVDWDCTVHTLFSNENRGCGKGVSGAIDWFFENETEGIILEDDCLPSPSFFPFCEQLLQRYRMDTRIMGIGGNNFEPPGLRDEEYSYWFSNHVSIWGWATWRRAWKLYDFTMGHFNEINKKQYLEASYDSIYERDYYQYVFKEMHSGSQRTWDYQWQFACKINSGLTIVPNRNLIRNLGFGQDATNTRDAGAIGHNLKLETLPLPLRHPEFIMADQMKSNQIFQMTSTSSLSRLKSQIKNILPRPLLNKIRQTLINMLMVFR